MRARIFFLCGLLSTLGRIEGAACGDESGPRIEGDRGLLDLLTAAQMTGRSLFPRGALDAVVRSSRGDETVAVTAHLVWSGSAAYWKYKQSVTKKDDPPQTSDGEMIETRDSLVCYWPANKLAQIIRDKQSGYRSELRLRPEERWFGLLDGSRDWSDLFDAGTAERPPKVVCDKISVARDGDGIVVRRHLNGRVLRITASASAGCNVTEYEASATAEDPVWYRGSYEWIALAENRWRLKSLDYVFSARGDTRNPEQRYQLSVTSFEPEAFVAEDRFRFESLGVPDGTLIEEVSAAGTKSYRKGRKEPTAQQRLDELAEELRRANFVSGPENH